MTGERLNPLRFRTDELPVIRRRREGRPGINRRIPSVGPRHGHPGFRIVADLELERRRTTHGDRWELAPWPLWLCDACFLLVPGWLLAEGLYDRCAAPRLALPPATQHRDPRRSRS
jgi:hypothetical protein